MARFFIDRPIVAVVISILMVIVGAVTMINLPVAQFPNIVPPQVQVSTNYVGADALTVEQSVATPIEQQISGVDNMNYVYSLNSTATGQMSMTVDFDVKTDPNVDLILTQMRTSLAAASLPEDVTRFGILVRKSVLAPLLFISLYSPDGTYDARFLTNYAYINLNDLLTRVPGIGNVNVFGAGQYAMRMWLKPDQLAQLGITVPDVISAIQSQNTVNPAGLVGGEPAPQGQEFTYSIRAQGRLVTPEDFEQIMIRETPDGGIVRLKDVARVELGAQDYSSRSRFNGKVAATLAVYQLPGSNALDAAEGVKTALAEARKRFPEGMDYTVALDTTRAITEGINDIVITLLVALGLVLLVVYVFLQSWRATLIPLLAVPVSLIGTFIFFPVFGFSINTLSLFGLVLAIGLVVDDAIIVVECVERHIEEGMEPRQAALRSMQEISGPVIGIALVLSSVFVPTAFIPGITGRLYQQFAVTIAISVILSAFNALTLSPALSALLLRPRTAARGPIGWLFGWFNRLYQRGTGRYVRLCGILIRKSALVIVLLAGFGVAGGYFGSRLPSSFLPDEDQGYLYVNVQLPNGASLQRTDAVCRQVEQVLADTPGVKSYSTVVGFSLLSFIRSSYGAFHTVALKDWADRTKREENYQEIRQRLNRLLSRLPEGIVFSFAPPAIPGVGTSGGFTFVLQDRAGKDVPYLAENVDKFLAEARKRPELTGLSTTFFSNVPQLFVDVDREKVLKHGIPLNDVYRTIQAFMGGVFVNYFNRFGRQWQVYVQAEGQYRAKSENVGQFYVRTRSGEMVPLSSITRFQSRNGPEATLRFNLYRSAQIMGNGAPGYSSSQAMAALEDVFARSMPREMGYSYMGMSFQEKKAQEGLPAWVIFGFSLLFVFLILAALYESWSLPLSVLMSVPVAVFGAFFALWLRRVLTGAFLPSYRVLIENDVYSQIGLVMLIGLAAKDAILIVEFARNEHRNGRPLIDAALEGARLRLRPILMTSFAFILGCVPLGLASGAGSLSRQIMGTTVIGGMVAASAIGIVFLPAIFYMVVRMSGGDRRTAPQPDVQTSAEADGQ